MSYAFSMADMRTYLSYLRTKKQEILFDQAADAADDDTMEEDDDDMEADTDNKKKQTSDDKDMAAVTDANEA